MRRILHIARPSSSSFSSLLSSSSSPLSSRYHSVRSFASSATPSPTVPASLVKKLRDRTSAPMMECRDALSSALTEGKASGEDAVLERAVILLRQKGVANASAKLAGRVGKEGLVMLTVDNQNGVIKTASLLELNTETDFAARSPLLLQVARALANTLQTAGTAGSVDVASFSSSSIIPVPNRSVDPAIGALKTVGDAINHILATLRESIKFRRGHRLVADTQSNTPLFVGAYIHKTPKSSTGGNGEENNNVNAEEEDDKFSSGRTAALVSLKVDFGSASSSAHTQYALQHLANKLAMQVVACNGRFATISAIPSAVLDQEKSVLMEHAKKQMAERQSKEKKDRPGGPTPEKVLENMVQGRLRKFYEENVLSEQSFVVWSSADGHSEEAQKVSDVLKTESKRLGLKSIAIDQVHRYQLGEGIALAENPQAFADEVAEKIAKAQAKK